MTKEQLRKTYKEKRGSIKPAAKGKLEDLILVRFQNYAIEIPGTMLSYIPGEKQNEYDPALMERYCLFRNPAAVFAYPSISAGNNLQPFAVNDETHFAANTFGIDEPVNGNLLDPAVLDMVFVPLLAFDESGYRVGYGKGYYDRFLKICRPDVLKIGFSFFGPEQGIDDINEFDMPLDICITPERIYTFN